MHCTCKNKRFRIRLWVYKTPHLIPSSYIFFCEMDPQSERKVVTNENFDDKQFKNAS